MPYRNVRGVSRGVQDEEGIAKIRAAKRERRRKKCMKSCRMVGLTLAEMFFCAICFSLGFMYYSVIQEYTNKNSVKYDPETIRYVLMPPLPLTIAATFFVITYLDFSSWQHIRPTSYFTWIMVCTAGFLHFLLFSGAILFTMNNILAYLAILFGIITSFIFLADLICMLLSLKRFPAPYYALKRKHDKMDECVCTGDYDPAEEDVERPICRCGDHWGEPCTCDDPTCGCSAGKTGVPPCECCECLGERPPPRESLVSTLTGRDYEEPSRSIITQADFSEEFEELYCQPCTPGMYCIDSYPQSIGPSMQGSRKSTYFAQGTGTDMGGRTSNYSAPSNYSVRASRMERQSMAPTTSMVVARSSVAPSRLSMDPARASMAPARASMAPRASMGFHRSSMAAPRASMAAPRSSMAAPRASMAAPRAAGASRVSTGVGGIKRPSLETAARLGMHDELTDAYRAPSMALSTQVHPVIHQRKSIKSQIYSVYDARPDHQAKVIESIEKVYKPKSVFSDGQGAVKLISRSSTDEEQGEGDMPRTLVEIVPERHIEIQKRKKSHPKLGLTAYTSTEKSDVTNYMSDSEIYGQSSGRIAELPGQVLSYDDTKSHQTKARKSMSVSCREKAKNKSPTTISLTYESERPRTSIEAFGSARVIRNVSTTVRAVRTLSRVMEAVHESRSASRTEVNRECDGFPSESTITIKTEENLKQPRQ